MESAPILPPGGVLVVRVFPSKDGCMHVNMVYRLTTNSILEFTFSAMFSEYISKETIPNANELTYLQQALRPKYDDIYEYAVDTILPISPLMVLPRNTLCLT